MGRHALWFWWLFCFSPLVCDLSRCQAASQMPVVSSHINKSLCILSQDATAIILFLAVRQYSQSLSILVLGGRGSLVSGWWLSCKVLPGRGWCFSAGVQGGQLAAPRTVPGHHVCDTTSVLWCSWSHVYTCTQALKCYFSSRYWPKQDSGSFL